MKVVLIDDEPLARQTLAALLNSQLPQLQIVGEAGAVSEAVRVIQETQPELVFLDVDLKDGSGFDVLNLLKPIQFKLIFITAHQEYAMKAIKFSALDYILKPVSTDELVAAVNRVNSEFKEKNQQLKLDAFFNHYQGVEGEGKKIVLKTSESIHIVNIQHIVRCEADNNYTTFFTVEGEKIIISKGLKEYEDLLSGYGFFRVHQSHLINLNYISRFDKKDGGFVVLTDKTQVPVSQRKRQQLFEIFEHLA